LKERLKIEPAPDAKRIQQLIADLDHARFEVRQASSNALEKLGEAVEPALTKLLADKPPLEVRQRIDALLTKLEKSPVELTPDELRSLRAIRALEQIGTKEAQRLLEEMARGNESSLVTQDAMASAKRLNHRRPK
jgi:HEAT repeat protein